MSKGLVALILAGGAARGAYEVGVVMHILTDVAKDIGRPGPVRHPLRNFGGRHQRLYARLAHAEKDDEPASTSS